MPIAAISPNFIVKVPKAEENLKREMDGALYLHPNYVYMTRNTQCGIIEAISDAAKRQLPEAEIGDMLLMHHFVQRSHSSKGDNEKFVAMQDDECKFYNVTSKEWNGQNNMTYGVYKNNEIIPHRQFVFLEKEAGNKEGWHQTDDEVLEKIADIKRGIEILSRTRQTQEIMLEMKKREAEIMQLSASMQTKEYLPYKIAYANKYLGLSKGTMVYVLNIAANTIIDVLGTEYRVVDTKYIGAV